jgi:hypothetical protein
LDLATGVKRGLRPKVLQARSLRLHADQAFSSCCSYQRPSFSGLEEDAGAAGRAAGSLVTGRAPGGVAAGAFGDGTAGAAAWA